MDTTTTYYREVRTNGTWYRFDAGHATAEAARDTEIPPAIMRGGWSGTRIVAETITVATTVVE